MSTRGGTGVLYVVSTPIGNLEDLSGRARRVLAEADTICCEDTRHTGQLLAHEGITPRRLVSLHAHNEASRVGQLLELLEKDATVALVSDAGTPLLSDPGERLVAACVEAGVSVVAVPGPSALLAGLVVSGFSLEAFTFRGFLERKGPERAVALAAIASSPIPVVCYESPQRIGAFVEDLRAACGDERTVSVSRELTKLHEEQWRGRLGDAASAPPVLARRGEYVVVVGPAPIAPPSPATELAPLFERLAQAGLSRRDAIAAVEIVAGVSHRDAYDAALSVPQAAGPAPVAAPGPSRASET